MKNLLAIFFLLFLLQSASGQSTFVKTIDGGHSGQYVRVLPTNDQGFAVFSLDSLKLYKFNSCGNVEWAKQYDIPISFYAGDIIKTRNGGFALFNRVANGSRYALSVTVLDATGNISWSREYQNPVFNYVSYTISQDAGGNFVLLANAEHINLQPQHNLIAKIDENGNFLWAKHFYLGPIWGGGIVTSDGGILARFGTSLLKTDDAGNTQWISSIFGSSYYYAPIEVSDGYIFPGNNTLNEHFFHKIDRQGNLLWGGRKTLNYPGALAWLYKKDNGNFLCTFNKWVGTRNLTTLFEFDKDLNLVEQNTLNLPPETGIFTGKHVAFSAGNATIFAGKATLKQSGSSQLFVGKTNAQLQVGCDTTLALTITPETATQTFLTSPVFAHTLTATNSSYPVRNIPATLTTHCSSLIPAPLNIRTDTLLCPSGSLTLQDKSGTTFDSYLWSTGQTTPAISIAQPGKYWLRAITNCGSQTVTDTVIVSRLAFPQPTLTQDSAICQHEGVLINAEIPGAAYRWQDGSTNAVYQATKPGNYEVDITFRGCIQKFSVKIGPYEKLVMPNIFTPNNDTRNDIFTPMEICGVAAGTLKIFNRWGQLLFETSDLGKGWNGSINGKKAADGVYFYLAEYINFRNEQKKKKGWLELVGD